MDGISSDRFVNGRLFRPASLTQAQDEYVSVVYKLARSEYIIDYQKDRDGAKFISLQDKESKKIRFIRADDYKLCVDVVTAVGNFPLFPSEPLQDIFGRIKANITLAFAGRNPY
jgi:hypothetical protein